MNGAWTRRTWPWVAALTGAGMFALLLEFDNDRLSAFVAGLVLAGCLYVCLGPLGLSLLSPPLLYLCVFALFHLGMALPWALGLYRETLPWWFVSNSLTPALALVELAMASYLTGLLWVVRRHPDPPAAPIRTNEFLFVAGVLIYLAGCAMFLLGIRSFGGMRFFDAGYAETYRLAAKFDPRFFGASFAIIPIGLYLAAASFPRRWKPLVLAITLSWVAGIFFLGYRGFALIPGLVVLALLHRRNHRIPAWISATLLLLMLAAIPLARATREEAVEQRSLVRSWSRIHLLDGVVEMGGSLRPLVHTLVYMQNEPWRWGKTYWQSLGTVWPNLALSWEGGRHIALEDLPPNHWLTAQAEPGMYRQYGGLGFSAVAEPYMNFGLPGVVLYFLGLGVLLARATEFSSTRPLSLALWAVILGPLLWTTRNSFEIFFRPAVWGVGIVLAVRLGSRMRSSGGVGQRRTTRLLAIRVAEGVHARIGG